MRKLEKNEKLLLAGQWTSHIGNILFDYANSVTIVSAYAKTAIVLAVYQSSETLISIIFTVAVLFMPVGSFVFSGLSKTDSLRSFLPVGIGIILLALAGLPVLSPKRFQK